MDNKLNKQFNSVKRCLKIKPTGIGIPRYLWIRSIEDK